MKHPDNYCIPYDIMMTLVGEKTPEQKRKDKESLKKELEKVIGDSTGNEALSKIHEWVLKNFSYVPYYDDKYSNPEHVFRNNSVNCEDARVTRNKKLRARLRNMGIKNLEQVYWQTFCKCDTQETFEIIKARKMFKSYIIYGKCPVCGTVNNFILYGEWEDVKDVLEGVPIYQEK